MNQCVCRVFGILLVVVIYTALTVEGVAFGGDCTGSATCDGDNTECNGSNECVCASTYYRNSGNTACVLIVTTLAGTCDIADTAPEQCSFSNTECTADGGGGKCLCKATFYSDGSACQTKEALNANCNTAHTDPCDDANSECKDDSGTTKCLCKDTHFEKGGTCTLNILPDTACVSTDQCVTNAECDTADTNDCKCKAGYTATPSTSPTMCSGVVKFATLPYMYVIPILVSMMFLLR